jgi:hypothetical protein
MNTSPLDPELVDFLKDDPDLLGVTQLVLAARLDDALPSKANVARGRVASRRHLSRVLHSRSLPIRPRALVVALVGLVAILVPAAFALNDEVIELISGQSPPASVSSTFTEWNRMSEESAAAAQAFTNLPLAVAERAHGVVRLRTPGGSFELWTAPEKGGGECFMVEAHASSGAAERSFGSCDSQLPRYLYSHPDVMVPWPVSFGNVPGMTLVLVRVFHADAVELQVDESVKPLQVVDGFALAAVPAGRVPPGANAPVILNAKNAEGATIATDELRYASGVG